MTWKDLTLKPLNHRGSKHSATGQTYSAGWQLAACRPEEGSDNNCPHCAPWFQLVISCVMVWSVLSTPRGSCVSTHTCLCSFLYWYWPALPDQPAFVHTSLYVFLSFCLHVAHLSMFLLSCCFFSFLWDTCFSICRICSLVSWIDIWLKLCEPLCFLYS